MIMYQTKLQKIVYLPHPQTRAHKKTSELPFELASKRIIEVFSPPLVKPIFINPLQQILSPVRQCLGCTLKCLFPITGSKVVHLIGTGLVLMERRTIL